MCVCNLLCVWIDLCPDLKRLCCVTINVTCYHSMNMPNCKVTRVFLFQRYGWHGAKDEALQRNVDLCLKRYPWLKSVRDRSVTEFEFMHGHLNKPGAVPASFAFRAKVRVCIRLHCKGQSGPRSEFVFDSMFRVSQGQMQSLCSTPLLGSVRVKVKVCVRLHCYGQSRPRSEFVFTAFVRVSQGQGQSMLAFLVRVNRAKVRICPYLHF